MSTPIDGFATPCFASLGSPPRASSRVFWMRWRVSARRAGRAGWVLLLLGLGCRLAAEPADPGSRWDVAAFVWPSYHDDPRARVFWPEGFGEWQTVMQAKPKFQGHEWPRFPLWGYVNEADRYVMEMQIAAAADHGVNVFIYDWYWYDGMPFLEACLNDGYLKARNNDRVKFYLMWANHDVRMIWDKRNADDAFNRTNNAVIWKGGVDFDEFQRMIRRTIAKYFSHPSYYRIEGKPVYMIYDMPTFVRDIGGLDRAREAIAWFREEVQRAGFPGLELQATLRRDAAAPTSSTPQAARVPTQSELVTALGLDSASHYQYVHMTNVDRDFADVQQDVEAEWKRIVGTYDFQYFPHVSVGWDTSARGETYVGQVMKRNPPAEFEKALRAAKAFLEGNPARARLITVNSWNEWTEASYLQPDRTHGYGYLEAVKRVFVDEAR